MIPSPPQIALFGTSADPPTLGHQAILQWLGERFDRVAVWASDNPFKQHHASLCHRSTMLRLAVDDLGFPADRLGVWQDLSDRHSWETLQRAKHHWGETACFTLVIGGDLVGQVHRWYRSEDLLPAVDWLIMPRSGYPFHSADLDGLSQRHAPWRIAENFTPPAISSSAYRDGGDPGLLIPSVVQYIHTHHLYPWSTPP